MEELSPELRKQFKPFNLDKNTPIVYGMHYPGIILVFGMPYNDFSVKPPCYRVAPEDARVGFNMAKWIERLEDDVPAPEPEVEEDEVEETE